MPAKVDRAFQKKVDEICESDSQS